MKKINPLLCIDFYKSDHRSQYPEGTTLVYSNFTARSNKLAKLHTDDKAVLNFGLQYFIKYFLIEVFNTNFFNIPKERVIKNYKRVMESALGKDCFTFDHIEALHDLQYLPIEIRALPEGELVPIGVPLLTISNTHSDFFWLTNYLETILSNFLWKPITSATTAREFRKMFLEYTEQTNIEAKDFIDFQGT